MGDGLGQTQSGKFSLVTPHTVYVQKISDEQTNAANCSDQSHSEAIIVDKTMISKLASSGLVEVFSQDVHPRLNSNWEVVDSTSNLSGIPNKPDMFEIQLNEINVAN